jgi:gas vesicle protein
MNQKDQSELKTMLMITLASFTAGVVAGMLLSPKSGKENRAWINENTRRAGHWINRKGQESVEKARVELDQLKRRVSEQVDKAVPNLYTATENIALSDKDLMEK